MPSPWKDPRTGIFHVRRMVPTRLRAAVGKSWWKASLRTKEPSEAKRRFPEKWEECEQDFEMAQTAVDAQVAKKNGNPNGASETNFELTDRLAKGLAKEWLRERLESTEDIPSERDLAGGDALDDETDPLVWTDDAVAVSQRYSLPIAVGSGDHIKLCEELRNAEFHYWGLMSSRAGGDWAREEKVLGRMPDIEGGVLQRKGVTFWDVFKRWEKEDRPSVRRKADFKRNIERFIEQNGDIPLNTIKPEQVVAMKDKMVDAGLAPTTTDKRLSTLSSLLDFATKNKYIDSNPAKGIRIGSKKAVKPRQGWTPEEIKSLLDGPVHRDGQRPQGGGGDAAYWMPLMALYSGARLAELGQLKRGDVGSIDGVAYFEINDDGGKSVKTESSKRRVPLHRNLLEAGFMAFVDGKDGELFPDVKMAANGQYGKAWGAWFGRYKNGLGVGTDFHGLRHTFITAARDAGLDKEVRDTITGHAREGVSGGYGASAGLKRLKTEIDKVSYFSD